MRINLLSLTENSYLLQNSIGCPRPAYSLSQLRRPFAKYIGYTTIRTIYAAAKRLVFFNDVSAFTAWSPTHLNEPCPREWAVCS